MLRGTLDISSGVKNGTVAFPLGVFPWGDVDRVFMEEMMMVRWIKHELRTLWFWLFSTKLLLVIHTALMGGL